MANSRRTLGPLIICIAGALSVAAACVGAPARVGQTGTGGLETALPLAIDVLWSAELSYTSYWDFRPEELGGLGVSSSGVVVATTRSGMAVGLDGATGTVRWERNYGAAFTGPPTVVGDEAYIPTPGGILHRVSASSGGVEWSFDAGSVLSARPVPYGEFVMVTTSNNRLHVLNRESGELVWSFAQDPPSDVAMMGSCVPVGTQDGVIVGFSNGALFLLDWQGAVVWVSDLSDGNRRLADVDMEPTIVDGIVYASSFNGGLFAVELATGNHVWHSDLHGATRPVVRPDALVTTDADGRVLWLDPSDGSILRELELETPAAGAITEMGNHLLVPGGHRGMYIIDADSPWVDNRFDPQSGVTASPVGVGSSIYVLTDGGFVYALRAGRRG